MDLVFFKRDSGRPGTSEGASLYLSVAYLRRYKDGKLRDVRERTPEGQTASGCLVSESRQRAYIHSLSKAQEWIYEIDLT